MILAELKDKLEDASYEWTGGEHIVIGHYPSGQRLDIEDVCVDADGVINILTGGRTAGETDSEMMNEIFEPEDEAAAS